MPTTVELRRAGLAVSERLADRGLSLAEAARAARVDPKTLRALINGERVPSPSVLRRIETALGWPTGEIARRGRDGVESLRGYSERDLLAELQWRFRQLDAHNQGLVDR
jgi:transcriptional regulator with XRE-family HTH domain